MSENYVVEVKKRIEAVRASLTNESERGLVLVGAAFLDEELKALLQSFFKFERSSRGDNKQEAEQAKESSELFGTFRPLGAFEAKISLAFSLGLVQNEHKDLNALRRARNKFAHNITASSFSSPEVEGQIKNLVSPKAVSRENVTEKILHVGGIVVARVLILNEPGFDRATKQRMMGINAKV